jgi:uridine kinase
VNGRVVTSPETHPFAAGHRPADFDLLAKHSFLAGIGAQDLGAFVDLLDEVAFPRGFLVFRQGDAGEHMFFVLEGEARVRRGGREVARLGPGDHFGEVAILGPHVRTSTVETETVVRLARLPRSRFLGLGARHPRAALHFVERLAASVAATLTAVGDDVGLLLRQRSLPRRSTVHVDVAGKRLDVGTGTLARTLLPRSLSLEDVGGALVVAATLDHRLVSLDTPVVADCRLEPVSTASAEGRLVQRRSCLLLVLEAARRALPSVRFRVGPRVGEDQLVFGEGVDAASVIAVERALERLCAEGVVLREELWHAEEARTRFAEQGWEDGAALVASYRAETVPLVACGETYALSFGPVLAEIATVASIGLEAAASGMRVRFGPRRASGPETPWAMPAMSREANAWLEAMQVTSAGRFNEACAAGQVGELVRVSEGFHERNIVRIADEVAKRGARVVTIAGPSSSGKTTFIRRLKVQLEVAGIVPLHVSLDDYYVDRERTPRDAAGELDFEGVEALDRALLRDQLTRLLAGEPVTLARFDFVAGKSRPNGGEVVSLGPNGVLLVEGLHASNPNVLGVVGDRIGSPAPFRIFVCPAMALPLDRLSPVLPEDVRLLRRIVRDRRRRGYSPITTIARWDAVRRGEEKHVLPYAPTADVVFDTSLVYEMSVLRVFAERYLLEVPPRAPEFVTAHRLRQLVDRFVPLDADHVPPTSILREFIGGGFEDA